MFRRNSSLIPKRPPSPKGWIAIDTGDGHSPPPSPTTALHKVQSNLKRRRRTGAGGCVRYLLFAFALAVTTAGLLSLAPPATVTGFRGKVAALKGTYAYATANPALEPYEQHPIHTLMKEAKEAWENKVASQSKTLSAAIQEYRRRYNREPPPGFDLWFQWAQDNDVQLLDEFDSIADHIFPLFSLSPAQLHARIGELEFPRAGPENHAIMRIRNHTQLEWTGANWRPMITDSWNEFVDEFKHMLPDMDVAICEASERSSSLPFISRADHVSSIATDLHDGPMIMMDAVAKEGYRRAAEEGKLVNEDELPIDGYSVWDNRARTCLPDSKLRQEAMGIYNDVPPGGPLFVADHTSEMNYCEHPKTVQLHGSTSSDPGLHHLKPTFAMSRTRFNGDILWPASIQYSLNPDHELEFLDKPVHKVIWRGSPDGIHVGPEFNWKGSHRFRLIYLTNSEDDVNKRALRVTKVDRFGHEYQADVEATLAELNARYMNIKPTQKAVQCEPDLCKYVDETLPFVPKLTLTEMSAHRYSARFRTHLLSNQVVLKSTRYPEWYSGRIQPWLHYVPVSQDYSDLYNILAFFDGGLGQDREGNHDELAAEIARASKEWAEKHWRMIDTKAYLFRLLLEYARLLQPDRLPAYTPNNP
ncbi:glycosyltransferase family 90 protein [Pseudohyphozyma bogoriensis]|nr:glycosyltransferase family 90 protein [Pseudohyphozyma bogoriensis]